MTADMWIAVAILAAAIMLFVTEWLRVDVVALGVVISLILTNILSTSEALAGFSSSAVLTIASLFIVGGAVLHTGLAALLGQRILRIAGTDENRLIMVIMLAVAVLSGFMSDTGTVAVLLPAIIALARSAKLSPSKLLIPLSFGSLLGGAMTLIGTPPNIIVSDLLHETGGYETFDFFSFTPVGLLLLIAGISFMVMIGQHILPDHNPTTDIQELVTPEELVEIYNLSKDLYYLRIGRRSNLINKTIRDVHLRKNYDVTILEILRSGERPVAQFGTTRLVIQNSVSERIYPTANTELLVEDVLVVQGEDNKVRTMVDDLHLILEPPPDDGQEGMVNRQVGVAEVLLPPRSSLIGKKLSDVQFAPIYNVTVMGITRPGEGQMLDTKDTVLQFGDTLIVQGFWHSIHDLKKNRRDLVVMGEPEVMMEASNIRKAPFAALVLVMMIVVIITDALPLVAISMLAALGMVLTGCLTMDEAYNAIDWRSIVLIAGMLPMATALQKVGLVDQISTWTTDSLGNSGPYVIMAILFILTSIFTQVLSNTATTVLIAPIALATAQQLNVQPHAFLMAVAIAASMAFASPVASPVNTLVLGAGNYRFGDYIKIGVPMIILMMIVAMVALPIFFPF